MQDAEKTIISRLFASFTELERAIQAAKRSLAKKEWIPADILKRVESYDSILEKQRLLAEELCQSIRDEDWEDVARRVGLINGLSSMIREDAREILRFLTQKDGARVPEKVEYC